MSALRRIPSRFLRFLYKSRKTILLILVVAAITLISSALIAIWLSKSYNLAIPTVGTIYVTGFVAYGGDINSTHGVLSIDLGEIYVGSSKNVSFYLRSVSNVPTTLALSVDNWEPESLEPFIPVSWNYSGKQIAPNEEIPIRIDINTVASADFVDYLIANHVDSFSFSPNIQPMES
jgi:hypothetical protein